VLAIGASLPVYENLGGLGFGFGILLAHPYSGMDSVGGKGYRQLQPAGSPKSGCIAWTKDIGSRPGVPSG